ncbi:MAG TPA: LysR family transcriptional regulator [Burkholderiaceae bacterium]|jgi:DNA-binding transcriptional LysR family regulator
MTERADFDKIELYLIRVLTTLITERSVSRAAMRLRSTQPAVSAQLKKLRALTGDPLLVRAGNNMAPTETALRLLEPASRVLQDADRLFSPRARQRGFDPATSTATFRIAASDYLDPRFLPEVVAQVKRVAPLVRLELLPLTGEYDYRRGLAAGQVELVIGNWLKPPEELHLGRLMSDEIVCLVAEDHPALRSAATRGWTAERYLACEHVAPTPLYTGLEGASPGVIDEHLASLGLKREVMVKSAHFSLIPLMVAQSLLVLTTGRLFCSRYVDVLPVRVVRCPVPFPALTYYQLWHDLTHASASGRWLREQVRDVAARLGNQALAQRARPARAGDNPVQ